MLFSSGSEQKSITHILYRFSVLSSIYICIVSMNLYYILCKYIDQYNMLIHSILRIPFQRGYFPFRCVSENWYYRESSDQRLLRFIFLPETGDYSPVLTYLPRVSILLSCYFFSIDYRRLFSNGRGDVLRHSLSCTIYIFQRILHTAWQIIIA